MLIDISKIFVHTSLRAIVSQIERVIAHDLNRERLAVDRETYQKLLKLAPPSERDVTVITYKNTLIEHA